MSVKDLVNEFGALKFWVGAIMVGTAHIEQHHTLTLNGVYQFLRDAPAIVNSNDSLIDLSTAVESFQAHVAEEEELFREQVERLDKLDANVDYLVCLRTERARELETLPPLRNCEEVLLNR